MNVTCEVSIMCLVTQAGCLCLGHNFVSLDDLQNLRITSLLPMSFRILLNDIYGYK